MFDLTIDNILLLIGTLQGLFLAIVAGFKKKGYKWSNIFLSLFIFNYTFDGPILSFIFSDPFYKDLFWYFPLPAKYSVIPFLILYIGSIYQKPRVIRKSILILLFLPSLIELLCSLFFFIHHLIFPENTVNTNLIEDFYFFLITYFLILFNLFLLVYLYKWMLNKNKLLSKDDTSKILWLRNIVAYFIFIQIVEASLFILNQLSIIVFFDSYIFILIIFELVFITYISLRGFYHADLLSKFKTTIIIF